MKQYFKVLLFSIVIMFALQSCYDDYRFDYEYSAVYFAVQKPVRTVIVEEGKDMSVEIGVALGGKYINEKSETVQYKVVPELLNDYPQFELLPESYYTLSNGSEIVIPSGEFFGTIDLNLNESFIKDSKAHTQHYALPVQITSATTDSVLATKDYSIIVVNYENKYYGGYWIKGVDHTLNSSNEIVNSHVYSNPDLVSNNFTIFSTAAADTSLTSYVGLDISGKNGLKLGVKEDGNVAISTGSSSDINGVDGAGNYNANAKEFYLDYTYMKGTEKHQVKDTLVWFAQPQELITWE